MKIKMKICMVVPEKEVKGGIASVVNGYRETGFPDHIATTYIESYCDGGKIKKLKKAIIAYLKFVKILFFSMPDMIHIHSSFGPSFYRKVPFILLSYLCKVKIINHIHGAEFEVFYTDSSAWKKKLVKTMYNLCDVIIVLSEEWKYSIGTIVDEEKIRIVENYCIIPQEEHFEKKKQILFLGEISERKGCYDLAQIYQKIVEAVGEIPFIIAGDGEAEEVEATFKGLQLESKVMFTGWVRGEKKKKLLEESQFFLFPTYNEGMPMVILEAMAYNMAIVTTNVGGIPKLIENGKNGFLCEPGDIHRLAEKMILLICNEELREKYVNNSREKVVANFSLKQHLSKIIAVYEEVYHSRG
ncbi:MAG: glycosyltransferase family 4 protein [Lachnospiraceae bacterium]|nr:glycosyltransferase family 4 protein [Lachnospiraceae bacterium]